MRKPGAEISSGPGFSNSNRIGSAGAEAAAASAAGTTGSACATTSAARTTAARTARTLATWTARTAHNRWLAGQEAFTLHFLAGELARAAHGLGLLADALFRGLLEIIAQLHFTENALALHLLLERLQSLIDVVVANENLHPVSSFRSLSLNQMKAPDAAVGSRSGALLGLA
jgi:hypothetical protein